MELDQVPSITKWHSMTARSLFLPSDGTKTHGQEMECIQACKPKNFTNGSKSSYLDKIREQQQHENEKNRSWFLRWLFGSSSTNQTKTRSMSDEHRDIVNELHDAEPTSNNNAGTTNQDKDKHISSDVVLDDDGTTPHHTFDTVPISIIDTPDSRAKAHRHKHWKLWDADAAVDAIIEAFATVIMTGVILALMVWLHNTYAATTRSDRDSDTHAAATHNVHTSFVTNNQTGNKDIDTQKPQDQQPPPQASSSSSSSSGSVAVALPDPKKIHKSTAKPKVSHASLAWPVTVSALTLTLVNYSAPHVFTSLQNGIAFGLGGSMLLITRGLAGFE